MTRFLAHSCRLTIKIQSKITHLVCIFCILVQYCRTDTTREWLDMTCTTRTTRTGRETMVYGLYRSWINGDMHIISIKHCTSTSTVRPVRVVRLVRVVKQWFTSRTVGEVYIIRDTYGVYTSPRLVRLVKQWFTSRTIGELHIDYILMISNSAELIPPVRDKHATDNAYSSL